MGNNGSKQLLTGFKKNYLTIMKLDRQDKRSRRFYLCKCDCGNEKIIQGSLILSGNTKSCGCLRKEVRQLSRLPNNHSELTAIILGYKRHAKARGFKFLLQRDFVNEIIRKNCFYCGCEPSNLKMTKNSINGLLYNGIDRINSMNDYTKNNVVPCCGRCNKAKGNMSKEDFIKWIIRVYKHAMANQWS